MYRSFTDEAVFLVKRDGAGVFARDYRDERGDAVFRGFLFDVGKQDAADVLVQVFVTHVYRKICGAAVGAAVGTGAGVAIGHKMDKKAAEAAKIEGAQVEVVKDANNLDAVKVTFDSGILFAFNSSTLSNDAKASLRDLAKILKEDTTTDIAIIGHTDKVGTYEANMKVSKNRAYAVENYLQDCGVSPSQFKQVEGVGYNEYDESLSAAQNRRVVIFMYASEQMIKNAEAGK